MKGRSIAAMIAAVIGGMYAPIQATGTNMRTLDRKMARNSLRGLRRTLWDSSSQGTYVTSAGQRRMKDRVLQYAARSNEIQGLSIGEKKQLFGTGARLAPNPTKFHIQYNNLALIAKHTIRERNLRKAGV
jgi:hypothetical protein